MKIIILLSHGPAKTKDLRKLIGIQSSTILHGINDLEKEGKVLKKGDYYYLSEIGKIMALKLIDTVKTFNALKKCHNLWLNHEIDAIPKDLLLEIGHLSNSMLVESEMDNISKTHENHIEIVLNSTDIKGVSPIYYPVYTEVFKGIIEKGIKVELVLTEEVLNKTINSLEYGIKDLKKILSTENLILWVIEDSKAAFTVTDKFMTLGLFLPDGRYDPNRNLVSNDKDAIEWANRLFEYYRQKAKRFEI